MTTTTATAIPDMVEVGSSQRLRNRYHGNHSNNNFNSNNNDDGDKINKTERLRVTKPSTTTSTPSLIVIINNPSNVHCNT